MKTVLLFSLAISFTLSLPAQVINLDGGTTRAVVVGISDYQDEKIPDLRFAHRDALAFADFLRSKAGGSLTEDQLKVLTNERATTGEIYMALDWLLETTKEGDLAILYISGHGDAELKRYDQPGFLLTWNSPAQIPLSSSIHLTELQSIIATISLKNKAKVLIVTDACRSGMLAGREGGAKMANAELAAMSEKAIKIMSCQPDELSYEGEQWGGGRGAFSYFLVNGLYGLADGNADQQVTLMELGNFLQENVSREVSPSSQYPKVDGNPKEKLAEVFPDELARIKESLDPLAVRFKPVGDRGIEDEALARVDSATREMYQQFKQAVSSEQFFEPTDACADTFYTQLTQVPELKPLYNIMKRNYAAVLMDDAQEAMNGWLRSDPRETESWGTHRKEDYLNFPRQLERAAELLGKEHYLYNDLKAKKAFFLARIMIVEYFNGGNRDSARLEEFYDILKTGLAYDSLAPYLHAKMGYYFGYLGDIKKNAESFEKAINLAPSWVWAYSQLGYAYLSLGNLGKAKEIALKANQLDSTILKPLQMLSSVYGYNHQFDACKVIAKKSIEILESQPVFLEMDSYRAYMYFANGENDKAVAIYRSIIRQVQASGDTSRSKELLDLYGSLGFAYLQKGDFDQAYIWFAKSDSIQENKVANFGLFISAYRKGLFEIAEKYWAKFILQENPDDMIACDLGHLSVSDWQEIAIVDFSRFLNLYPDHVPLHYHLSRLHLEQKNDYEKGVPLLERAVQLDSTHAYAHYHLAAAYAHLGKKEAALDYLEKALALGYDDPEGIEKDERWEGLRGVKRYRELMKRDFPEEGKD